METPRTLAYFEDLLAELDEIEKQESDNGASMVHASQAVETVQKLEQAHLAHGMQGRQVQDFFKRAA